MIERIDIHSETWDTISKWVLGEIERCLNELASLNIDEKRTQHNRGRIDAYRKVLSLGERP